MLLKNGDPATSTRGRSGTVQVGNEGRPSVSFRHQPLRRALFLVFLGVATAYPQSLKETTDWLRDYLKAEANVRNVDWRDQYRLVPNGCVLTVLHDTEDISCTKLANKTGCSHSFRQVFNLKDIDLARIEVEPEISFRAASVKLTTFNERPLVAHAVKMGGDFVGGDTGEAPTQAYVVLRTREAAERVAKAFRNGVAQCGGKRSAF